MGEKVLVTGGSGFVARWCLAELIAQGYDVGATVRTSARRSAVRAAIGEQAQIFVADLTSDEGWDRAMEGCDYVLHVASPLGSDGSIADLIGPARDGTVRVLRAAARAGVKRTVLTSSTAACTPTGTAAAKIADETVWTDAASPQINAYRRSKVLAERAAWEFVSTSEYPMTLTTILPGAIFGPVIGAEIPGSVEVIQRLLAGKMPGIPRIGFSIVDVRDLADLHIAAMAAPQAAGERFIATGDFLWMEGMAKILRAELGEKAAGVPTRRLPSWLMRGMARVVPAMRTLTPLLDRELAFSSAKARDVLGFAPRPGATTVVDCARDLMNRV